MRKSMVRFGERGFANALGFHTLVALAYRDVIGTDAGSYMALRLLG
ncbi:hypothetical protein [Lacticaseibacillus jixiensis]